MQPDAPLSPAARDVMAELESYARDNPDAPAPALVRHLALTWIPGRLKRQWPRLSRAAGWGLAVAFGGSGIWFPMLVALVAAGVALVVKAVFR